jgi:hypothetical protein
VTVKAGVSYQKFQFQGPINAGVGPAAYLFSFIPISLSLNLFEIVVFFYYAGGVSIRQGEFLFGRAFG